MQWWYSINTCVKPVSNFETCIMSAIKYQLNPGCLVNLVNHYNTRKNAQYSVTRMIPRLGEMIYDHRLRRLKLKLKFKLIVISRDMESMTVLSQ